MGVVVGLHVECRTMVILLGASYFAEASLVVCSVAASAATLRWSIVVVLCTLLLEASTRWSVVPTLSVRSTAAVRCLLVGLVCLTSLVQAAVV